VTQDHLDFFGTFENYCNTKVNFFIKSAAVKHVFTNIDCFAGVRVFNARPESASTYSLDKEADFVAKDIKLFATHSEFTFDGEDIHLKIPARFNIYNALAVIAVARALEIDITVIKEGLRNLRPIAGRYNTYAVRGFTVIIDYAHTPDGLTKLIETARETMSGEGRIITVFGCGGNRDKEKRPLMGAAAVSLSDFVVITSDNPRNEKPMSIMRQIEGGIMMSAVSCRAADYILLEDRTSAIKRALGMALAGDVVIIAGKGGEEHQEIGGVFHKYSDENVIKNY